MRSLGSGVGYWVCSLIDNSINTIILLPKNGTLNKNPTGREGDDEIVLCQLSSRLGRGGSDRERRGVRVAPRGQERFFAPSQKTEKIDFERPWAANLTPMPPRALSGPPRARRVGKTTGLRPQISPNQPARARVGAPEGGRAPREQKLRRLRRKNGTPAARRPLISERRCRADIIARACRLFHKPFALSAHSRPPPRA